MKSKPFESYYYGNDRKKIYLQFSDRFVYFQKNFNAEKISKKDSVLLQQFGLKPNRKMLFSYHSESNRSMLAQFSNKQILKNAHYQKSELDPSNVYYFRTFENESAIFIDNLIPYKTQFIRIIERSKKLPIEPSKGSIAKKEIQQTFIYPKVFKTKPF